MVKKTKKKRLSKYMQKKAEKVNKILNEWRSQGLTSNDYELATNLFNRFYRESRKKNVKDKEMASTRILVDYKQRVEYNKILDFVLSDDFIDLKSREAKNKAIKNKYKNDPQFKYIFGVLNDKYDYITDEQSFMDLTDNLNRVKDNKMLSMILSSDQIANLYGHGINKGYKESQIDELIIKTYKKIGLRGSSMYEKILKKMKVNI